MLPYLSAKYLGRPSSCPPVLHSTRLRGPHTAPRGVFIDGEMQSGDRGGTRRTVNVPMSNAGVKIPIFAGFGRIDRETEAGQFDGLITVLSRKSRKTRSENQIRKLYLGQ